MALRVLHVVESLAPDAGSVGISLRGLFDATAELGIESRTLEAGAVGNSANNGQSPAQSISEADVVHLHGCSYPLARKVAEGAHRASKHVILSPHGGLSKSTGQLARWGEKLGNLLKGDRPFSRAAVVAAVNEMEEHGLNPKRITGRVVQLPYGLWVDEYQSSDKPSDSLDCPEGRFILILGPMHPREGFVAFLKSLAELGPMADDWKVVIAGQEIGTWRKELEAAIERKGAAGRVMFVPALGVAAQRAWLSRASIFASPSLQIGCGIGVMQAAASGVPVLASTFSTPPGLAGVVKSCGTKRYELVKALRQMLELTDAERAELAAQTTLKVRSAVDWSSLSQRYQNLYESLA